MKKSLAAMGLMLSVVAALCPVLTAQAAAADPYNYTRAGDTASFTVNAADFLTQFTGEPVSAAERAYLEKNEPFALRYTAAITSSYVSAEYSEQENTIGITARPYSYLAKNGVRVTWNPYSVNGAPMSEKDGIFSYMGTADNVTGDTVSVEYRTEFTVRARDISSFLNSAYTAGETAAETADRETARYESEKAAYDGYVEALAAYETASEAYRTYLEENRSWTSKNERYQAYLREAEQYRKDKELYDAREEIERKYLADLQSYRTYLADLQTYEQKMEQYREATASPEAQKVLYQLSILDYLTKPMTSLDRTISGAILGESVTRVLAEKDAIVLAGAEKGAVERANTATIALRTLLERYNTIKTDEDRYIFYVTCQKELSENFNTLFRCLEYFNGFDPIRKGISMMKRTEQYEVLLAQLYYLCNALDNAPIADYIKAYKYDKTGERFLDSSYRIGTRRRDPAEVLGAENVLADKDDALPLTGGYPNLPDEPVRPEEVKDPGSMPTIRDPGDPPAAVEAPGPAPAVVPDPGERPAQVAEPVPYRPTEEETALAAAFKNGEFTHRNAPEGDGKYTASVSVRKYFRNARTVTVYFYLTKSEGAMPECTLEEVDVGTLAEYNGRTPVKSETGYEFVFDGWEDETGEPVDITNIPAPKGEGSDLRLYPRFRAIPIKYRVVWSLDGKDIEDECAYGTSPVYDSARFGVPQKTRAGNRLYRFTGCWISGGIVYGEDGAPLPEMTDKTVHYVAQFEASYLITWSVDSRSTETAVWPGDMPDYGSDPVRAPDSVYRYTFTGWDHPLAPATEDAVYVAEFERDPLVKAGGKFLGVSYSSAENVFTADCASAPDSLVDAASLVAVASASDAGIRLRFMSATASFSASSVHIMSEGGVREIKFSALMTAEGDSLFSIDFTSSARAKVTCPVDIVIVGNFDPVNSYLFGTDENGVTSRTHAEITATAISFTMYAGVQYDLYPMFKISLAGNESVTLSVKETLVRAGTPVTITAQCVPGVYLGSISVVAADGTEVAVSSDMVFTMPKSSVAVVATAAFYEYTITFRSEGMTLATRTMHYGDTVIPPADPVKAPDDTYQYVFTGWDKPIETVTGDAVYNATFRSEPLPVIPTGNTTLSRLIHIAYWAVPLFLAFVIALIVFLVVRHIRKKKKKAAKAVPMSEPAVQKAVPEEAVPAPETFEKPEGPEEIPEETFEAPEEVPASQEDEEGAQPLPWEAEMRPVSQKTDDSAQIPVQTAEIPSAERAPAQDIDRADRILASETEKPTAPEEEPATQQTEADDADTVPPEPVKAHDGAPGYAVPGSGYARPDPEIYAAVYASDEIVPYRYRKDKKSPETEASAPEIAEKTEEVPPSEPETEISEPEIEASTAEEVPEDTAETEPPVAETEPDERTEESIPETSVEGEATSDEAENPPEGENMQPSE